MYSVNFDTIPQSGKSRFPCGRFGAVDRLRNAAGQSDGLHGEAEHAQCARRRFGILPGEGGDLCLCASEADGQAHRELPAGQLPPASRNRFLRKNCPCRAVIVAVDRRHIQEGVRPRRILGKSHQCRDADRLRRGDRQPEQCVRHAPCDRQKAEECHPRRTHIFPHRFSPPFVAFFCQ